MLKPFKITDYLDNYRRSEGKATGCIGDCKSCGQQVAWSSDRVASHKRRNCKNVSQEERQYFFTLVNKFLKHPEYATSQSSLMSHNGRNDGFGSSHYSCHYCGKVFHLRSQIREHLSSHRNPLNGKDDLETNRIFIKGAPMSLNEEISDPDVNSFLMDYKCKCGKRFSELFELVQHESNFHPDGFEKMVKQLKDLLKYVLNRFEGNIASSSYEKNNSLEVNIKEEGELDLVDEYEDRIGMNFDNNVEKLMQKEINKGYLRDIDFLYNANEEQQVKEALKEMGFECAFPILQDAKVDYETFCDLDSHTIWKILENRPPGLVAKFIIRYRTFINANKQPKQEFSFFDEIKPGTVKEILASQEDAKWLLDHNKEVPLTKEESKQLRTFILDYFLKKGRQLSSVDINRLSESIQCFLPAENKNYYFDATTRKGLLYQDYHNKAKKLRNSNKYPVFRYKKRKIGEGNSQDEHRDDMESVTSDNL
uniref:CSON008941 protein n=1 Tax=Culicoides sonorensis TaxID=179676 RepID=A0A336LZG8_CULSO